MNNTKNLIILSALVLLFTSFSVMLVLSGNDGSEYPSVLTEHNDGDLSKGNPNADVQIFEYSDLQCPACSFVHNDAITPFLDKYPDEVYYTFRHFPLKSIHPNAVSAAMAMEAARSQSAAWEMQEILFENQSQWSTQENPELVYISYAEDLGLDIAQFEADLDSVENQNLINAHYNLALENGLNSTPSIFINGEKINNPSSLDELEKLIFD